MESNRPEYSILLHSNKNSIWRTIKKERFENPTIYSFITIIDFLSPRQIAIKEQIRI